MPVDFVSWFCKNGGILDLEHVGFKDFAPPDGGRGAVALKDIPEGHLLFTIPRSLTLSIKTSSLPSLFGIEQWTVRKLNIGWSGLILCMMYEEALGDGSKWAGYFDILPKSFTTPMFWNSEDLAALQGTSVVEKLGRDDAEKDYNEKLLPAVQSRPDLFSSPQDYTLEFYHLIGSRILSRSFQVEEPEEEQEVGNASLDSAMDVDEEHSEHNSNGPDKDVEGIEEEDAETEEEEEEDSSEIAMVPMADMLNARYQSENAKLFYEAADLRMVSTKPIKAGEQIWNTYGDLPNAELLRRYGHVDLLPLPEGDMGNPGDVVEVGADLIKIPGISSGQMKERIDWWLEQGGDDVFVFETNLEIPPTFVSLIRLLFATPDEWEKVKMKEKPPKPKMDERVIDILVNVLEKRVAQYPTTLESDIRALPGLDSPNQKHAAVVRIGEKRILKGILNKIEPTSTKGSAKRKGRTSNSDDKSSKTKKARR